MIRSAIALALLVLALAACGGTAPAESTVVTVTAPVPRATAPAFAAPTSVAPSTVTLPEVKGRNGGIVSDELRELGLSKVRYASRDQDDKVVVLPENWTAVKIEPAAGTEVSLDDTVVVTMTKN